VLWLWSNLPARIGAQQIADLYRRRWRIEGMFQRLESVLQSEIRSLGALLGFAVAVLACNLLAVLKRSVEQAHRPSRTASRGLGGVPYHLAVQVRSRYEGMLIALPVEHWPAWADDSASTLAQRLLALARHIKPGQVATSKRGPKVKKNQGVGRCRDGSRSCLHRPPHQGLKKQKTLKWIALDSSLQILISINRYQ